LRSPASAAGSPQNRYAPRANWVRDTDARYRAHPYRGGTVRSGPLPDKEIAMPRYMVERTFPHGLTIPIDAEGARSCLAVVDKNAVEGVTWVHSYVNPDRTKTFCVYDGPSPEAIRAAARQTGLPVDGVTEVRVLDPYFYHV